MTVATTGAVIAAIAEAVKASGTLVRLAPTELGKILDRQEAPLVVVAHRNGFLGPKYEYLTSYRGLGFYSRSKEPLELPAHTEVVRAKQIWMPG